LERLKPLQRNSSAAASAADQDPYRPELVADDEPRYLRRQKPVEIRRKKFGGKTWPFYRRVFLWTLFGVVAVTAAVYAVRYALYSPQMLLLKSEQIAVAGNHIVPREEVLKLFVQDRNRSVLRIPLDERRAQIQELAWVEDASVLRILPNHLRIEISERTPIAFFRNGSELLLVDAHGVLLDRPESEDFHFPIVTGLSDNMPREEREKRMQTYQEFLKTVSMVHAGYDSGENKSPAFGRAASIDNISEIDLGNPRDLHAVLTGLDSGDAAQAVTVHFGQSDFTSKFRMLVENFAQWQANAGRVQSIDLRFSRQVVVNPDTSASAGNEK
jgi:cell division protein FtsQ